MIENKLGIQSEIELAREEERRSKQKALEMFELGLLDSHIPGTVETLLWIHRYLFFDIYEFAGRVRTVNLAKGGFRFAPSLYLEDALVAIEKMPQHTFEEIIRKYVEMNVAHPFREGNGRSMRIWLDHMMKQSIGRVVDWSKIDKEEYLLAIERSPVKDIEIRMLLQNALTDRIYDREIYIKGIDRSYSYEGYENYRMEELG